MKKINWILLLFPFLLQAKIRLPHVIGDHMVLQRNTETKLWGWSDPGEKIIVVTSWNKKTYEITGSSLAKWQVSISTPKAGGPYEISITGSSNQIVIRDIMIGEVWVCSGQSNMEWNAIRGFDNAQEEVSKANYSDIRLFQIPKVTSTYPQDDCPGSWQVCSPESMRTFSAVGYFFGRELYNNLNIPIGLINTSWGGTPAEVWTPENVILDDSEFKASKEKVSTTAFWPRNPGVLYNAMIHPIQYYGIQGAIWYQGESNTANPFTYRRLFPAMIESWRKSWNHDFSFYYVQIAPFNYQTPIVGALVREAQLMAMETVPKSGMVVISDIGDLYDIHPRNKQDVGKRLAAWALHHDYQRHTIPFSGPIYKDYNIIDDQIVIQFDHAEGLKVNRRPVQDLFIAGDNKVFYPAESRIDGKELIVYSSQVDNPIAVRYAFGNKLEGNLINKHNLPASSFRTDDWPIILEPVEITIEKSNGAHKIVMQANPTVDKIVYTINGMIPDKNSAVYQSPLTISESTKIQARAVKNGILSARIAHAEVVNSLSTGKQLQLFTKYSKKYPSSGVNALTDGKRGSQSFNDGNWQGYEGEDIDVVIDLGSSYSINKIETQFLQAQGSWIFFPQSISFLTSKNGRRYREIHEQSIRLKNDPGNKIINIKKLLKTRNARYIKIIARNIKTCPEWHPGNGGKAWLFMDEIIVD